MVGTVRVRGTKAEQEDQRKREADRRIEAGRVQREREGHGLIDAVSQATYAKEFSTKSAGRADQRWREAIKAAVAGGVSVVQVADQARISRERVYQIRDDRR